MDATVDVPEPKGVGDIIKAGCPLQTPGDAHQVQRWHEQASDRELYLSIAVDLHVAKPWSWEKNINRFK